MKPLTQTHQNYLIDPTAELINPDTNLFEIKAVITKDNDTQPCTAWTTGEPQPFGQFHGTHELALEECLVRAKSFIDALLSKNN